MKRYGRRRWIFLPATAPARSAPTQHLQLWWRHSEGRRGCTEGNFCTTELEKDFQLVTEKICACVACQKGSRTGNYGRQAHSGEKIPRSKGSSFQKNNKNCWLLWKRRKHK